MLGDEGNDSVCGADLRRRRRRGGLRPRPATTATTTDGDGCSASCAVEYGYDCVDTLLGAEGNDSVCDADCGDGDVAGGVQAEACDDGNTAGGDGCSASCAVEYGYDCVNTPLGAEGNDSVCGADCGDGDVAGGIAAEACDDGNEVGGDGCSASCAVEYGYDCVNTVSEAPTVLLPTVDCGDGEVAGGTKAEACDDGNEVGGDGCSATCTVEDGYECVNAVKTNPDSTCDSECGDNVLAVGAEACDDGNVVGDDGCTALCELEPDANPERPRRPDDRDHGHLHLPGSDRRRRHLRVLRGRRHDLGPLQHGHGLRRRLHLHLDGHRQRRGDLHAPRARRDRRGR